VLGLLSPGGVHSHEQHIQAFIKLAAEQQAPAVYLHAFLDGRDTPPQSALASITQLEATCKQLQCGQLVSIIGRYYAMDRDQRWDRVQVAYELLTDGRADYQADTGTAALAAAYARGETDEFVKATRIHSTQSTPVTINDGDIVVFMNFRADRARELTRAFTEENFTGFTRHKIPQLADFISLTQYAADINTTIAFPPQSLTQVLGEYIAEQGLTQLRIAETEKYAHVTFFFNGGREQPFAGEERILVPSPKVTTYDLQPEMSAFAMTDQLVKAIKDQRYNLIVCNFANPDMVGHTGNFPATVKAIATIDQCLGRIQQALQAVGGEMIITADHGNAECMFDEKTQQAHTAHTCELVPFVYYGRQAAITKTHGTLADIAPTLLYLMNLPIPPAMTGQVLLKL
jgi:2,3-bisphosphoglycerate-independent phosphoglycerate mutase